MKRRRVNATMRRGQEEQEAGIPPYGTPLFRSFFAPCVPRHQIETTFADYARMAMRLFVAGDQAAASERFEREFADFIGCRHAIALSSGRLGLRLVLKALIIPKGSEVIIPAFNYFAVVEEFLSAGLRPVFADVRRQDLNLDPEELESLVTPRTRAILVTHMFGHPCDMEAVLSFARRQGLEVLEDCAHAFGSRYNQRHVGTLGRAGVFSLSVMKLITAFGGGVVTTNDDGLAANIRAALGEFPTRRQACKRFVKGMALDLGTRTIPFSLVAWPIFRLARVLRPDVQQRLMTEVPRRTPEPSHRNDESPRLHAFQSSLGLSQVAKVETLVRRRRQVLHWYFEELASGAKTRAHRTGGVTLCNSIDKHGIWGGALNPEGNEASFLGDGHGSLEMVRAEARGLGELPPAMIKPNGMYFGILVNDPEVLSRVLFASRIDSETSEYRNCADLEIYKEFGGQCPVARDVERHILRLPNHPRMTRRQVRRVVHVIRSFLASSAGGQTTTPPARRAAVYNTRDLAIAQADPRQLHAVHPSATHDDVSGSKTFARTEVSGSPRRPHHPDSVVGTQSFIIRCAEPRDIAALVDIHARSLPGDFLVRLGRPFLRHAFFPTLLASSRCRIYVAECSGAPAGFLVTRQGLGGFLGEVLRRRPVRFLATSFMSVVLRPTLMRGVSSVVQQLRTRSAVPEKADVSELFLMAVDPDHRRMGIGRALIEHSTHCLTAAGWRSYCVLLHAENAPADALYQHAGFDEAGLYDFAGTVWRRRERTLPSPAKNMAPAIGR